MHTAARRAAQHILLPLLFAALATNAQAALTDLGTAPMANGSSVQVQPNIFLMMDDSGSMAWDYMPDDVNSFSGNYGFTSAQCNGVYYDPTNTYIPPPLASPISLTAGTTVLSSPTITFASSTAPKVGEVVSGPGIPIGAYIVSLTGSTAATLNVNANATVSGATFTISSYPQSSFSAAPIDGFGTTTTATINLAGNFAPGQQTDTNPTTTGGGPAYYYNYTGTQTTEALRNFYNTSSTFYKECNSTFGSAPGNAVFTKIYVGTTSTLAISGSTSTSLTGITVNGQQIMSAASTASTSPNTVASNIAAMINSCASTATGNCTVAGYRAAADGSLLTIIAPLSLGASVKALTPAIAPTTGIMTITPTAFAYSGPGNTDETQNFANWYTFYRTRILMMKSASGTAFNKLDQNYRVGFGTMNNNTLVGGNKFLNLATFDSTQKNNFLTMLFNTNPGSSTPLLNALSEVGLMYANKISTINGVAVNDPMQYSCQQNYTILSTDGFWNDATNSIINSTGTVVTSTTAVGNQDGAEATSSKQFDGSTIQYKSQTGPLQWTTTQQWTTAPLLRSTNLQESGYQLAMFTNQMQVTAPLSIATNLQSTTAPLLISTATYISNTYTLLVSTDSAGNNITRASKNKTYNCLTPGGSATGSSPNLYCFLGNQQSTTSGLTSCTSTYNNPGTSTTDGSRTVTVCSVDTTSWSTPAPVGANGTCTPSSTVQCSIGATTTGYVTNFPTPSCSVTYVAGASNTANSSGNVVTACSTAGTYSTPVAVAAYSSCNAATPNVQCSVGTSSAPAYVTNFPNPSCTVTYNATGNSTTNSLGQVVTSCPVGSMSTTGTLVGPNGSCDWNAPNPTNPHLSCNYANGGALQGPVYLAASQTTCPTNIAPSYTPNGPPNYATVDANGLIATNAGVPNPRCTTAASYSTPQAVPANSSCTASANVTCSLGATTGPTYVPYNPPNCSVTYTAGVGGTTNSSGNVVTSCSVAAGFNPTWTNVTSSSPVNTSCTPGAVTGGGATNCQYNWGAITNVGSCVPSASSGTGPWTILTGTQCPNTFTGGTSNTLADVADYYYRTDLRQTAFGNCTSGATGNTLCSSTTPDPYDNVPPALGDTASWQHMTTFTLGLGARGRMVFDPNYPSETSTSAITDYYSINNLTANGTVCSWQASGICTWPIPNPNGTPENIDDLWHAAVDGRGLYYSATNPAALSAGLTNALAAVQERTGTAAAATTSDPNISQGNNFLFASTFVTMEWTGQFVREQMNLTTGQVITTVDPITGKSVPVNDWTAQNQLDSALWSSRAIYTFDSTNANGNNLKLFQWANLTTAEQALFSDPTIDTMSQLCTSPPVAWQANHAYVSGNQFVASGTPYQVLLGYTSGATFGVTDVAPNVQVISNPVCLPVWTATTFYPTGAEYRLISGGNTTWYHVNTAYTSGVSFGATDTANATALAGGANASGAAGANLVNFLRGERANEEGATPNNTKYFRYRVHVLGDIVDSEGAYVAQGSIYTYADPGYASFTSGNAARQSMVYVAANDGMLHAFYGAGDNMDSVTGNVVTTGGVAVSGGAEAWAYIPKMVLPNLYKLADKNYKNQHQYTVDGTPTVGDVCVSNCTNASTAVWKTILVAGLNGGGRGFYALDVTNPAHPVALWEYSDTNMGYSYGNPVITKLSNGTWVVLLTSGYNNVSPGDGQGRLYVLNAYSGTLDTAVNGTGIINTGVGSTTTPSGLARITAEVVDPATNNTTLQVYGGDLMGNLWRFDINNNVGAAGFEAQLITQLVGPGGVVQPITVKPEVGIVGTSSVVYVGTGRFLGTSDILATDMVSPNLQSLYGIYDPLTTTASPGTIAVYANPHSNTCSGTLTSSCFVQQTLSSSTCPTGAPTTICSVGQNILTSTNNPVSIPGTNYGWYVDLPYSGQRDNTDPSLQRGTLDFTINLPTGAGAACTNGGSSYNLALDYKTGGAVNTASVTYRDVFGISHTINIAGVFLGNALATRPIFVELPSGAVVALVRMGTGDTNVTNVPIGSGSANTRRVSWRLLTQ